MNQNGTAGTGSSKSVPALCLETSHQQPQDTKPFDTKALTISDETARFLPVMDLEVAIRRRGMIVEATKRLMTEGVDFGAIPGSDRPVLLQPGADKLCNLFGLIMQYEFEVAEEDFTGERHGGRPFFYYRIRAKAYRGEHFMGEGVGSCNAWEAKYRWRKAERVCPNCGVAAIIKGREEYGGGYLCFQRKGGCNAKFPDNAPEILKQPVGRVENPDLADVANTVLKMGMKRAKVACTINATSASEFFTQDLDDESQEDDAPPKAAVTTGAGPATKTGASFRFAPMPESPSKGDVRRLFQVVREVIGERNYLIVLEEFDARSAEEIKSAATVREVYRRMVAVAEGRAA